MGELRSWAGLLVMLCGAFLAMDVYGGCPGGGGGGGGSRGGGGGCPIGGGKAGAAAPNSAKSRSSKGMSGCKGGGGGNAATASEEKFTKWPLPASASIASLDTSKLDSMASALSLSEEQIKRVDALKKEIREEAQKLAKEQDEARNVYQKSGDSSSCMAAARIVMQAAQSCREFNPQQKFEAALAQIFSTAQLEKYRKGLT